MCQELFYTFYSKHKINEIPGLRGAKVLLEDEGER